MIKKPIWIFDTGDERWITREVFTSFLALSEDEISLFFFFFSLSLNTCVESRSRGNGRIGAETRWAWEESQPRLKLIENVEADQRVFRSGWRRAEAEFRGHRAVQLIRDLPRLGSPPLVTRTAKNPVFVGYFHTYSLSLSLSLSLGFIVTYSLLRQCQVPIKYPFW